jgi:hypothetical protein
MIPVLLLLASQGAEVSRSKLGPHLLGGKYEEARPIVLAGPPVIKVLHPHASHLQAIREYKARYPKGTVVMRIWTPRKWTVEQDPATSADEYWSEVIAPPLRALLPSDRKLIDYVEGPNESGEVPTWESRRHAAWFGRFWSRMVARMVGEGFRPCVGSIAVGNPPGSPDEIRDWLRPLVPALEAAHRAGGTWSYHSYTIAYTENPAEETWYALRYRLIRQALVQLSPSLAGMKAILTEGGVDLDGNGQTSGWQARGSAERFQRWLAWFDGEMQKDDYVLGCTLFQIGDPLWSSFDLAPIAPWLSRWIGDRRPKG